MRKIASQAGPFMAAGFVVSASLGALSTFLENSGLETAASPIPFYVAGAIGTYLLFAAYLMGGRSTSGEKPTVATVMGLWIWFSVCLIVTTSVYLRFELAFPSALPKPPDELFFGVRNAAFFMLFQGGWGYFFGVLHGWIGDEANPAPFGWIFRRASPGIGESEDDDE